MAEYVQAGTSLSYRINFENVAQATAPAVRIVITDVLDSDLDLSTFQLTEIAFANRVIAVPAGLDSYKTTVDLRPEGKNVVVQIDVSLDKDTRTLTATLIGIDPATGWMPEDPLVGILYPNDATGRGDGHISYLVSPKAGLASGTAIENQASIVFDWNDPIDTPKVLNTIDASSPTSSVEALTAVTGAAQFSVAWAGADETGGSGVATYDIFVSDNGGAYTPWLTDTAATSAAFTGEDGHTYAFYSRAKDNVGHVEAVPADPDAVTMIVTLPAVVGVELNGVSGRSVSAIDPSGMGVRTVKVTFSEPVDSTKDDVLVQTVTFPGGVETIGAELTPLAVAGSGTNTMTITLVNASAVDTWVKVTLNAAATADLVGNALDGEAPVTGSGRGYLSNAALDLPTGDGLPGGNAVFYVGSLRGDYNGDRQVTAADNAGFQSAFLASDADADFRGVDFGSDTPDGQVTVEDIDGFAALYQAAMAAPGERLAPLPLNGGPAAEEVVEVPALPAPVAPAYPVPAPTDVDLMAAAALITPANAFAQPSPLAALSLETGPGATDLLAPARKHNRHPVNLQVAHLRHPHHGRLVETSPKHRA